MTCTICGNKTIQRRLQSQRSIVLLVCNDCKVSKNGDLDIALKPLDKDARRAVKAVDDLSKKANYLTTSTENKDSFKVLVWGPAIPKDRAPIELEKKRVEIKQTLITMGHDVYFSEELKLEETPTGSSADHLEFDQLNKWAQFVVILDGKNTYGVVGEIHDHIDSLDYKTILWIPDYAKAGYSANGALSRAELNGVNVEEYTNADIECCVLKTGTASWIKLHHNQQIYLRKRISALQKRLIN